MKVEVTVPMIRNGLVVANHTYVGILTGETRGDLHRIDVSGAIVWATTDLFRRI